MTKQNKAKGHFELSISIKANTIDQIKGLIPVVVNHFMLGNKIGEYYSSTDTSNFRFKLINTDKNIVKDLLDNIDDPAGEEKIYSEEDDDDR